VICCGGEFVCWDSVDPFIDSEMIFPANHLTDSNKTKQNYMYTNQEHKKNSTKENH